MPPTRADVSHINVDTGEDIAIMELAQLIAEVTGFKGRITTDPAKPDGTPRKLMDAGRLARMGWRAHIGLREGIEDAYDWFLQNRESARL